MGPLAERRELICCNGALRVDSLGGVEREPLPGVLLASVLALLQAANAQFWLDYGDHFVVSSASVAPWMAYPDRRNLAPGETPQALGVVKLCVLQSERWLPELQALTANQEQLFPHEDNSLDMIAFGVSKATALAALLGETRSTVVAFGNDFNDHDLLGWADRAVLVGHGLPGLDRAGHIRRIESNDQGVADALRFEVEQVLGIAALDPSIWDKLPC